MDQTEAIGICFNVEPGKLEGQARLLVESLRTFGGLDPALPLYAFQPRNSGPVSKTTLQFFNEHNVVFQKIPLNKELFFHPIANKVFTPAYFEKTCSPEIETIAYLDSDLFVIKKLHSLFSNPEKIKMSPVFSSGLQAIKSTDYPGEIWKIVFNHMGVSLEDFWKEKSITENDEIYHYYNGGLIIAPRAVQLFRKLEQHYLEIFSQKRLLNLPYLDLFFLDQIILAAIFAKYFNKEAINTLDKRFNYPIEHINTAIEEAIVLHYQDYFYRNDPERWNLAHNQKAMVKKHLWSQKNKKSMLLRIKEIAHYQRFKIKTRLK